MRHDLPTARQLEVLRFIAEHIEEHGFPPTHREISAALCCVSTNGVNDHLTALEKKGLVTRQPRLSRTLALTDAGRAALAAEPAIAVAASDARSPA